MSEVELKKKKVLDIWREHKDYLQEAFARNDVMQGVLEQFWDAIFDYANLLICPYCHEQNVEVYDDDELVQGHNLWRFQCQHCGLETPEVEDAAEAIRIWDMFVEMFNRDTPVKSTWVDELPDKEKFIKFLKESAHYMWSVEVNSDETHQLILSVLESLGVKDNEDVQD